MQMSSDRDFRSTEYCQTAP